MAKAQEDLFIRIFTKMDTSGLNQGLEIFSKFNDQMQGLTNFLVDNTIIARIG